MKKQDVPEKMKRVEIRVSSEELKEIDEKAKKCGFCRSDYLRLCAKDNITLIEKSALGEVLTCIRKAGHECTNCSMLLSEIVRLLQDSGNEDMHTRIELLFASVEKTSRFSYKLEQQAMDGLIEASKRLK